MVRYDYFIVAGERYAKLGCSGADKKIMKTLRARPRARDERGMTMIEVSIAAVVLMGAVITMMTMFDTSLDILRFTTARSLATQISNEALEDLRTIDYEQVVIYDSGSWPTDDPDLDTSSDPPLYKDRDEDGAVVWRPLLTTDTAAGVAVSEAMERQHVNFEIRRYTFYVEDGGNPQAYKRLVVKAKWTGTGHPGEVVMTTNYALKDQGASRPLVKILGVRSSFYDHFKHTLTETTMGANEAIHGPKSAASPMPAVSQPAVWAEAVRTGSKSSYIKEVGYKLYSPAGVVLRETSVTSTSVVNGKYFAWNGSGAAPFNTTLWPDGKGYVIRAEALDDQGKKDVDALTINIDNTPPALPNTLEASLDGTHQKKLVLTWNWAAGTDYVPELSRYAIRRRYDVVGDGFGWIPSTWDASTFIASPSAGKKVYVDAGLTENHKYQYRVRAVDTAGNFSDSSEKERSAAMLAPVDAVAPNGVTSASVAALSWDKISVSWNAASDNVGGSGLGGYELWATDDISAWIWTIVEVNTDTVSNPVNTVDAKLRPQKNYYYAWRTFDNEGNWGPWYKSPYTTIYATTPSR